MKDMSELLREWRHGQGIGPSEAAKRCGLKSRQHYAQIEQGAYPHLPVGTLLKIADATGISIETLARAAELQRAVPA